MVPRAAWRVAAAARLRIVRGVACARRRRLERSRRPALLPLVAAAALTPPGAEHHPHEPAAVEDVVEARDVQVVERVLALLGLADRPLVDGGGAPSPVFPPGGGARQK